MERRPDGGIGNTTLDSSGLGTFDVTWKARAEAAEGKTSPEELIAAAHSACFSMAFSNVLARPATPPDEVNTKADVTFVPGTGITGSHLTLSAKVPGISEEDFQRIADEAKVGLPGFRRAGRHRDHPGRDARHPDRHSTVAGRLAQAGTSNTEGPPETGAFSASARPGSLAAASGLAPPRP